MRTPHERSAARAGARSPCAAVLESAVLKAVLKQIAFLRRGEIPAEDGARYYSYEDTERWMREKAERLRTSRHMGYPYLVHLETLASCNAACGFCPYPTLERKGTRMPDDLIEKIIGDL